VLLTERLAVCCSIRKIKVRKLDRKYACAHAARMPPLVEVRCSRALFENHAWNVHAAYWAQLAERGVVEDAMRNAVRVRRRLADCTLRDKRKALCHPLSSNGRCRRAFHPGHHSGITVVATVTFLVTGHGAATRRLDFARAVALRLTIGINAVGAGWCSPRRHAPHSAGERLELKALFLPTTAWLA
jgi:hypothetical protein